VTSGDQNSTTRRIQRRRRKNLDAIKQEADLIVTNLLANDIRDAENDVTTDDLKGSDTHFYKFASPAKESTISVMTRQSQPSKKVRLKERFRRLNEQEDFL